MTRFSKTFVAAALAATCVSVAWAETLSRSKAKSATAEPANESKVEHVEFVHEGQQRSADGRVVIEAADGGILFEGVDGVLWSIERDELQAPRKARHAVQAAHARRALRTAARRAAARLSQLHHAALCRLLQHVARIRPVDQLAARAALQSVHQLLGSAKASSCTSPSSRCRVLVFADRQSYDQASREDLPGGTGNIVGFYSLRSNRVNMFDLTGAEAVRSSGAANRRGSMREINQMLSQPAAVPLVATIVHEATHQIAFNCGLQTRFADIPLWLCEGMAVYFEAPDLASTRGWRGIGRVNYPRLETFRRNLPNWNDGSLEELLRDSHRFRDPRTAVDAYADAWALNYYLIKYEPKAYTAYLKDAGRKAAARRRRPETAPRRIPQTLRRPAQAGAGVSKADVAGEVT